jgi:hypothetical protein
MAVEQDQRINPLLRFWPQELPVQGLDKRTPVTRSSRADTARQFFVVYFHEKLT